MRPEPPLVPDAGTGAQVANDTSTPANDVFRQIGQVTRQLHDTLEQIGVMPRLQTAASGLPDARSRLCYIASKCGAAADKVLNSVDLAKADHSAIADAARALLAHGPGDAMQASDAVAWRSHVQTIIDANERTNTHLTDIMIAQDYHDLTGQVVAKVVALALDLEDSLVKILVRSAPEAMQRTDSSQLQGPVIDASKRDDVVANQAELDDLLATMGF